MPIKSGRKEEKPKKGSKKKAKSDSTVDIAKDIGRRKKKAVAEKNLKGLQAQLQALMKRIEESTVALAEFDASNKRTISENSNLSRTYGYW